VRQVIHSFSICHFKVGVIDPFASTAVGSGLRIGEVHPAVTGVSRKKRARHGAERFCAANRCRASAT